MEMSIREPAVAGGFYPAQPQALRREVEGYLDQADSAVDGTLRALIAPHAGYVYCGSVAGQAFARLRGLSPETRWRVLHVGPSHHMPFAGVAASPDSAWRTPLGDTPVELPPELSESQFIVADARPHAPEHCLEVQLPFLQCALADFALTPLLTGKVNAAAFAVELAPLMDERTLFVASTDLSHFHPDRQARQLDSTSTDTINALDVDGFAHHGDACGKAAVLVLLHLARALGWRPWQLSYATSAEAFGDNSQVVGYSAFAFTS